MQTLLPVILEHTPAGTSVKTVAQFAQVRNIIHIVSARYLTEQQVKYFLRCQGFNSKRFCRFDHGDPDSNYAEYGTSQPPGYEVSSVRVPVMRMMIVMMIMIMMMMTRCCSTGVRTTGSRTRRTWRAWPRRCPASWPRSPSPSPASTTWTSCGPRTRAVNETSRKFSKYSEKIPYKGLLLIESAHKPFQTLEV